MKLMILGVTRRHGKGKDSGNDYDMAFVNSITPLSSSSRPDNIFQAHGFRQLEIELDPNSIDQFSGLKFPAEYEVTTGSRPSNNGLVTVVTGLQKQN